MAARESQLVPDREGLAAATFRIVTWANRELDRNRFLSAHHDLRDTTPYLAYLSFENLQWRFEYNPDQASRFPFYAVSSPMAATKSAVQLP